MYYLQTRYYDPETGRFINADDPAVLSKSKDYTNGLNLYAYCFNNPIMTTDETGDMPKWLKWLAVGAAILGAVLVIAAITVLTAGVGTTVLAGTMAGAVIHGAAIGALIGAGVGIVAGGIIGGATTGWSLEGILTGMALGFGGGALIGAVIGGVAGYSSFIPSKITGYTKHGLDRALSREGHGVSPKGILDAVKNPIKQVLKQSNGGYKFVGKYSITVLNKFGKIITTIAKTSKYWRF